MLTDFEYNYLLPDIIRIQSEKLMKLQEGTII